MTDWKYIDLEANKFDPSGGWTYADESTPFGKAEWERLMDLMRKRAFHVFKDFDGTMKEETSVDKFDGVMPFGKHKGKRLNKVPTDYLEWAKSANAGEYINGFVTAVIKELRRRADAEREFAEEEAAVNQDRRASTSNAPPPPHGSYAYFLSMGYDQRTARNMAAEYMDANNPQPTQPYGRAPFTPGSYTSGATEHRGPQVMCSRCTDGKLRNAQGQPYSFCTCKLGQLQLQLQTARDEARNYQSRMVEAERKAREAATGTRRPGWDADPVAPRTSITKHAVKAMIGELRRMAARKWHPDVYKESLGPSKMAEANAILDWFEKCAEKIR